ncbi:hypothetical protein Srut_57240 [Streptomyces rutgersensis]|nr:hypothetical protein Srut_57240 [Streptomyces rutgersensis]
MAVYAQTPGLRKEGSVWPTPDGIGVSKDSWLLAIGLALTLSPREKHLKNLKAPQAAQARQGRQGRQATRPATSSTAPAAGPEHHAGAGSVSAGQAGQKNKGVQDAVTQGGNSHQHAHRHGPPARKEDAPAHREPRAGRWRQAG